MRFWVILTAVCKIWFSSCLSLLRETLRLYKINTCTLSLMCFQSVRKIQKTPLMLWAQLCHMFAHPYVWPHCFIAYQTLTTSSEKGLQKILIVYVQVYTGTPMHFWQVSISILLPTNPGSFLDEGFCANFCANVAQYKMCLRSISKMKSLL